LPKGGVKPTAVIMTMFRRFLFASLFSVSGEKASGRKIIFSFVSHVNREKVFSAASSR
jgi:hypothetical protein